MKPTLLKFWLDDNDDDEITCLFCGYRECDQSISARGGGKLSIYGVHSKCAQDHLDKHITVKRDDN